MRSDMNQSAFANEIKKLGDKLMNGNIQLNEWQERYNQLIEEEAEKYHEPIPEKREFI